ncbi:hypothetical protein BGZ93_009204 [Podila epicladia]|nr:hypothetical protein BGZ92_010434 [Podila epicladia]KAG0090682.1 hypothetical protein BGZ93_009204 [Podila epicladia]
MGVLNLLCLASDGNHLYGYAAAQATDKPNSPFYNILIRSSLNPESASAIGWTLVNAHYDGLTYLLGGEYQCTVDDEAVFTIIATSAKAAPASLLDLGAKGLRFTPISKTSTTGTWRNIEMPGYGTSWKASFSSTLFSIKNLNNALMHAYLNTTDQSLIVAALDTQGTQINLGSSPWALDPLNHGALASIGYADNKLYIFGNKQPTSVVTVIPILSNSTVAPAAVAVYNATSISNTCSSGMQAFSSRELATDLIIACDSPTNQTTYFFSLQSSFSLTGPTFTPMGNVQNSSLTHTHLATMALTDGRMKVAYMFGPSGLFSIPLILTPAENETWTWRNVSITGPANVTIINGYGFRTANEPIGPVSPDYEGTDQGLTIGASVGGASLLLLAMVVFFILHRRRKRRRQHPKDQDDNKEDKEATEDKDDKDDRQSADSKDINEIAVEGEVKDSTLDDGIPLVLDGKLIAEVYYDDDISLGENVNRYSTANLSRSSFSALSVHPRPQVSITMRPAPSQLSLQYPGALTTAGNPQLHP